jgi:hypothetical protein
MITIVEITLNTQVRCLKTCKGEEETPPMFFLHTFFSPFQNFLKKEMSKDNKLDNYKSQ